MASAAPKQCPEDSVNSQECPVCMERYRDPRVLQCAHHFCKVCLEEIADRHPQGSVTCPTCRHVTPIEGDTGVTSLPRYRVVNDFIGNVKAAIDSNPTEQLADMHCDVCKATQATKICFGCNLGLCDSCNNNKHTFLDTFQDHKTFPISTHMFCDCQKKKLNLLFCKTCEQMCCPLSAIEEHSEHECHPVETEATIIREALQDVISSIRNAKEEKLTSAKIHLLLDKAKKTQSDFKLALDSIKTSMKQLETKVAKIEEEIITNLSAEIKHLEMISCDLDDYKDSKEKLEKHLTYLTEEASNQELFVRQRELPKYDPDFYKQLICKPEIELPVLGNTLNGVTDQLDKYQQELKIHYDKYIINNHDKVGAPLTNLKKLTDLNVGNKIYGLAVDSVRERLVARRKDTTAPITVYDFQGQQLQVLGKDVEGIADNCDQDIAIDTKRDLYILPMPGGDLFTMDMNGTVKDKINVAKINLHGVSYCETDCYITSSCVHHIVYVIDANTKQIVHSFSSDTKSDARPFCVHSSLYISGIEVKPAIFVCNNLINCINIFDLGGKLLKTYSKEGNGDIELNRPIGACTDPGGRIIVCDQLNYRILSIWSEGSQDKWEILVDKKTFPEGRYHVLTFDPVSRRLFVANYKTPGVMVFQG